MRGVISFCETMQNQEELLNGCHFVVLTDLNELSKLLNDEPQLLFIDTSVEDDAVKIVEDWRKNKNPQLIAISVASFLELRTNHPCFDRLIDDSKPNIGRLVVKAIAEFHCGILRRRSNEN